MTDLSGSVFILTLLLVVILGTILAAVGFAYTKGYFRKSPRTQTFCTFCGSKIGSLRRTCGNCGAPAPGYFEGYQSQTFE
jgi:hypothetical protein